jgi:hypothetical protein
MSKSFNFFRFFVLIAALLPLSCVTQLPPPKGLSSLNDKSSIVFGKIEVRVDDELIDEPSRSIFHPRMQCLISPYISNDKLNRNRFRNGKYAFVTAINKNGYFSFVIPPGKYYFVELEYIWLFSVEPSLDVRTYMSKQPFCMTFDVPANRAVYIGTILNDFQPDLDNPLLFKTGISVAVTNNFQESKNWFLKSNPELETNIVERDINITPL